ncbi:hypothetical protein XELAEV_18038819mg [Xenopus laevis]|uniref:Uncharacterized protein n=1 Tax=Xenopus laevis TaxID=8355 RepID=A0A974C7I7_XENLA|nr:hypothetical protein XELAEV_18038819mg [Xenopus laevis]
MLLLTTVKPHYSSNYRLTPEAAAWRPLFLENGVGGHSLPYNLFIGASQQKHLRDVIINELIVAPPLPVSFGLFLPLTLLDGVMVY